MLTLKNFISMLIPSSIFGLTWFYWRWKKRLHLKDPTDYDSGYVQCENTGIELQAEYDILKDKSVTGKEDAALVIGKNVEMEIGVEEREPIREKDFDLKDVAKVGNETSHVSEEKCFSGVDLDADHFNTQLRESVLDMQTKVVENEKKECVDEFSYLKEMKDLIDTDETDLKCDGKGGCPTTMAKESNDRFTLGKEYKTEVEEEIVVLSTENTVECGVVMFESVQGNKTDDSVTDSIASQISVDCFEEDLASDDVQSVNLKRLRNRSSCGDSAIVEDYSSDCLSITGSDSAVKSFESESSVSADATQEVSFCKEECFAQDNGHNYRDWYGSSLGSDNTKEMSEKSYHWGSVPVSDSDSDSECILKRSAQIESLSLDKLSIVLNQELSNIKTSEKMARPKSPKHPKPSRRRSRKSESRSPKKSNSKNTQSPRRSDLNRKPQNVRTNRKDIDKPWRSLDCVKKPENVSKVENEKREISEYEFPDDMCGRLIGKAGRHISEFKEKTGVDICIECELRGKNRVVSITGLPSQIKIAEKLLNDKFHDSLKHIEYPDISCCNHSCSKLPENTDIDVIVTAIVDASNFYVQIYHQDVDEKLMALQSDMAGCYSAPRQKYVYSEKDMPKVGDYCAAFIDNIWCRVKVSEVFLDTKMVDIFFIDYGGNVSLSIDNIWKIRHDMLELPAQAVHCCLNNIVPLDGVEHSYEANDLFFQYVEGKALQARVVTTENDISSIRLTYYEPANGEVFSIGEQMLLWGSVQEVQNAVEYASL